MEAMHNPFEQISARLSVIEQLLIDIKHRPQIEQGNIQPVRRAMDINEFCAFTGLAKQTAYKLTANNQVPFSKPGKKIWFDRAEVENWLLQNRRATIGEAAAAANDYIQQSAARRTRNR